MTREHGTRAKYVVEKCRCEPCTAANRVYARERDRRTRRPDEVTRSAYVSATSAREHLVHLATAGIGRRRIAELTGVAQSSLHAIKTGRKRRISRSTRERILAVTTAAAADGAYIDAAETWRLVDELLAAGWTKASISAAIGQDGKRLQLGESQVTVRNAALVAGLAARARRDREDDADRRKRAVAATDEFEALYLELAQILEERQEPWRRRAACVSTLIPVEVFFIPRGETVQPARNVCAQCLVSAECAAAGARERFGIWGGLTEKERRQETAA